MNHLLPLVLLLMQNHLHLLLHLLLLLYKVLPLPFQFLPPPRVSLRTHSKPKYLEDYVCSSANSPLLSESTQFTSTDLLLHKPQFYQQAVHNPICQEFMTKEFQALKANHTWDIVPLPPKKQVIPCKWVYKIKQKSNGTIERYKARLIIGSDSQVADLDFSETFSLVVKITIIKCLLTVAAKYNWSIH